MSQSPNLSLHLLLPSYDKSPFVSSILQQPFSFYQHRNLGGDLIGLFGVSCRILEMGINKVVISRAGLLIQGVITNIILGII